MKGQTFLLTAMIIILALISLKAWMNISRISSEKEILDVSLEEKYFKNIGDEIKRVIAYSAYSPDVMTDNSINFLNFTQIGSNSHSLGFTTLFVGTKANSTNQTMNITVFNLLNENNVNVTIKLNTTVVQRNSTLLNDSDIWSNNFTFTAGELYNLTVSLPNKDYEKNVTVETNPNKDVYVEFYDLTLISERATHKNVFQQTMKFKK